MSLRRELFLFKKEVTPNEIFALKVDNRQWLQTLWRFSERKALYPGYPAPFKQMFVGFADNVTKIDAVFERPDDGMIVFFAGKYSFECLKLGKGETRNRIRHAAVLYYY